MGACGANPLTAPRFSHGAHFQFLELFARGDIRRHSGQLSRALRVRSVRPCPRPTADRSRRQEPRCARARRSLDSKDFAELVDQPARVAARRPARRSPRSRRSSALDPITTNFLGVLAPQRPQGPAAGRHPRLPPPRRRASRRNHRRSRHRASAQRRPGRRAQAAAPHPRRPRRHRRRDASIPNILGGIVVKLGSQQIDASIRTKLNRLAHAMKG